MEKVKITSVQEGIIKSLKSVYQDDLNKIMKDYLEGYNINGEIGDSMLDSITPAEMSLILFFDHYEVEMTKEEELLNFYNKYLIVKDDFDTGVRYGVENVLSIYGIEIEGITD